MSQLETIHSRAPIPPHAGTHPDDVVTSDGIWPEAIQSKAPATGALIAEAPNLRPAEVEGAVERARRAQESWGALPLDERCRHVFSFRDALVERAEELVDLLVLEAGKPRHEALVHEVMIAADTASHLARIAPEALAERAVGLHLFKHRKSSVHWAPRGVVAVISGHTWPLAAPLREAVAALLAGNAVVIKPSELTPLVALKAKEIWDAAGLPPDVVQVVTGLPGTGAALVSSMPDMVAFTGSVAAGRRVAAACGERLIPCVTQLGGKAPLIACSDADVERTARAVVYGAFSDAGQGCTSVERVYAHRVVYDRLLSRVVALTRQLRLGDPAKGVVDVGAMVSERGVERAEAQVADALEKGAELLCGGKRHWSGGRFFEPTVLGECSHAMSVMTQETCAPIVAFMRVSSDDEAIQLANSCDLGLNAYVFCADRDHGRALARRIHAGSVLVNDVLSNMATPDVPFGGVKRSGHGRALGKEGLRQMCDVRHVSVDRFHLTDPLWFPYSARGYRWMKNGMSALLAGGPLTRLRYLLER